MVSEHSLPLIWGHFLTTDCGSSGSKYLHRNIYLSSGQGDNSVFILYLIASFEQGLKNEKPKSLKKTFYIQLDFFGIEHITLILIHKV